MSNTLREYQTIPMQPFGSATNMYLTAFVGGEYGASVQFTMKDGSYCCLSEYQVRDLISTLQKRLRRVKKYQATSSDIEEIIEPKKVIK